MMYSEFAEAVGCKDNEHNHKVFRNLEIMYMNSDMTKAEIYEYGKKLVDNSKSEEQMMLEAEINAEIADCKREIENCKAAIEMNKVWLKGETDKTYTWSYKSSISYYRNEIKSLKNRINALKWVLE